MNVLELAERGGISRRCIKYYRHRGLIPPPVGPDSAPVYGDEHLEAIRLILAAKAKNVTLVDLAAEVHATYPFAFREETTHGRNH